MPSRRLLELLVGPDDPGGMMSGMTDDVIASIAERSLSNSFGELLGDDQLSALWVALDSSDLSGGPQSGREKSALCRSLYDRLRSDGTLPGIEYDDFESAFKRFLTAVKDSFSQIHEQQLMDLPCRELRELSLDELSGMQAPEDLSRYMIGLAGHFRDRKVLSREDADHFAGLVEKMAGAPGYLRFLGEEKKREETARLSGMLMTIRSTGIPPGPAVNDLVASLGLLLYNIVPSEKVASCLARVPPSVASRALQYHYNVILALNYMLTGQLDLSSSYAGMAIKSTVEPNLVAYVSILQGCIAIRQGDNGRALKLFSQAYSRVPAGRLRAQASFYRGIVYYEKKEYANAIRCFESARAHATDPVDLVTILNNIGSCALYLGDVPRAGRVSMEMERLSGRLNGDHALRCQLVATSYAGAIWRARGENARAVERYQEALKLALRSGDGKAVANQLGNLGTAYALAGDGDKAFQRLNACMAYSEHIGYRAGIRFAYWHIRRMLLKKGNRSEARKFQETYSSRYPELRNLR